ncbi:hypothetical protein AMS68_002041 [Peltaster fructicola]|uniref:DOC domain-containing protein n=1 Tax=Peltaster fructicola TaxID=286661 RepID=A0A6H0XP71_9PEZI|nr:hypothetical protein AMS68_002041 [Peltaster fructicola]
MPTVTRRQGLTNSRSDPIDNTSEDVEGVDPNDLDELDAELGDDGDVDDEEEDEGELPFPPPGLKEISSLASWTVSTAKPGNGVAALRSPDMTQFWQSDGPQPHLLSIHFFKLVPIVLMRIFLDFKHDESYTPTKIQFLAGMGAHDLQEFAEMELDQPQGWIDVDFSNVGPVPDGDDESNDENEEPDYTRRPVLRAMLVQVKILENLQNGKDTHLRGVQIFARDDTQQERKQNRSDAKLSSILAYRESPKGQRVPHANNIKMASWMQEPDLR